ncbi:GNAT family N-acetyltransferase [Patescibacteria group bacterium]|nr:GNAT family N-acetyltransferase [Patescibacteria group bacterium]
MKNIKILNDVDKAIQVMHGVGMWMEEKGLNPGEWWKPENMNRKFLLQHTEPDEYFVALIDEKPAASMILQETERNQSWKSVDGNKKSALYVHWLCVNREFASQGLSDELIKFAKKESKKRGFSRLRLDTDGEKEKLCSIYKNMGFTLMGTDREGTHLTAFYQM